MIKHARTGFKTQECQMSLLNKIGRGLAANLEKSSGTIQPSTINVQTLPVPTR